MTRKIALVQTELRDRNVRPAIVTADALPPGGRGPKLKMRVNGQVVQLADTQEIWFSMFGKKPPICIKDGDVAEVEIEGIGVLCNPVRDEGEAYGLLGARRR